LVQDINILYHI